MTRAPLDLSLYLVTDTDQCGERGLVCTVRDAIAGGVTTVQLRDPDASDDELVALGLLVRQVLDGTGVPLIVNDRVHLVDAIGADGVHVGQDDIPVEEARSLLGPSAYVGLSVHTLAQLDLARQHTDAIDYIGVGPVWATTSKANHAATIGIDGLRDIVRASPWPCVAIGGITADRASRLRHTGASGVAVISAICAQADAGAAAQGLVHAWQQP
ncbi:thiamine phosphate synthase [Luteipulveratus mongoliensis]|uniref:Thiamine-phosphate synthase n=1 Tax=Luteipulveratus mongoliensis TaxID=571913 RepID=A0A0K1JDM5_9MICO|nr:thiamine phosphate synthase [Luteipulveratus mongoliensis]AKU14804.1 thiamine-phosphate synthase [Luteipulveratus mongoliensis]